MPRKAGNKVLEDVAERYLTEIAAAQQAQDRAQMEHWTPPPAQGASAGDVMLGLGAGFVPGAGVADVLGQLPGVAGEPMPSTWENLRAGNWMDAGLQMLSGAGDVAYLLGAAPVGVALKAPRASRTALAAGRTNAAADAGRRTALIGVHAPKTTPVRGATARELAAMREAEFTPKELEQFRRMSERYPVFAESADFMLPQEVRGLIANEGNVRKVSRLLEVLPSAHEMSALSAAGAPKRGWYRASTQAIVDLFGPQDAPRFASLLASLSPRVSVEGNLLNTLNVWKNWTAAGRPTDPADIRRIMAVSVQGSGTDKSVMDAWFGNAVRALTAADPAKVTLSGPKVDSFYRNLADDVYRVTNDAWIANVSGVDQGLFSGSPTDLQLASGNPGLTPGYIAMSARTREGAQQVGMLPAEGQETAWSIAMPLMEMQQKTGIPARDLLERGMLTPEVIRGTPDFSTLFHMPRYGDILTQAGYGPQLSALTPFDWGPPVASNLTTAQQNDLLASAARLEQLGNLRGAERRRARYYSGGPIEESVFVTTTGEATPGPSTGMLPEIMADSYSGRSNYTSRLTSALTDEQGMDIIRRALRIGEGQLPTRTMSGAYRPSAAEDLGPAWLPPGERFPLQSNPGYAVISEVPLTARGDIPVADKRKLDFDSVLRSAVLMQDATPWNAQVIDEKGLNAWFPLTRGAEPDDLGLVAALTSGQPVGFADTGGGVAMLNFGDQQYSQADLDQIRGLLTDPKLAKKGKAPEAPTRTRHIGSYPDLSEDWRAGFGSGRVTGRVLGALDQLSPADIRRLENDDRLSDAVMDVLKIQEARAAKDKSPLREDFVNMMKILAKGKFAGLRKAWDEGEIPLAAVAAIGLLPALLPRSEEAEPAL